MEIVELKKILFDMEKQKEIIAEARDELYHLHGELEDIINNVEDADDNLDSALGSLAMAVDYLSEHV